MATQRILILDFGSQVTQLIARRVRENGVYAEILPCTTAEETIRAFAPVAIILSGGPASVHADFSPRAPEIVFTLGVPVLGICYGEQTICEQLGGKVEPSNQREFGRAEVDVVENCPLFAGVWEKGKRYPVWMSHGDKISAIPQGFTVVASTPSAPYAAIADVKRRIYGLQFHAEVAHTPDGGKLLKNFTHAIAGCKGDWSMDSFRTQAIEKIRAAVGSKRVVCGVSGGVDSSVVAALLHQAIGAQLVCIFVDTGMLRENEGQQVKALFATHFHIPLVYVDASLIFLDRLKGITDPERKRKIIGETFVEIFEHEAEMAGGADFLAQGTLYPDVIESVSVSGGPSQTIKSHHNVGGLPERMKMALVEPVRELFKDEVRRLGVELGMPADMVGRHPFPGPGLAIRVPGEITGEKLALLRRADSIYIEEIRNAGLYNTIWQAFAVLLPVKTVGVMGDERTYEYVCALRAVTSTDGMTADYYSFEHSFLARVSTRIINEVRGINRIVYDITSKPPGTIEWESAMSEDISILQEIDEALRADKAYRFWKNYGKLLLTGCAVIVVLTAVSAYWKNHLHGEQMRQTHLMLEADAARADGRYGDALAILGFGGGQNSVEWSEEHVALAKLQAAELHVKAGERDKAVALLNEIISSRVPADDAVRDSAVLRLHGLTGGTSAFAPADAEGRPFSALAQQMKAARHIKANEMKEAAVILKALIASAPANSPEHGRAVELLQLTGESTEK